MKKIRRPLVDINWNDFMTGKPVVSEKVILQIDDKRLKRKIKEAKEKWYWWKIYVDWLWLVSV